jgi:hypothetical protein
MVCLLGWTAVLPAAAQDAPVPCTADEAKQVSELGLHFGDQMNTVSLATFDKTLDGDTAKMLGWAGLYRSFFNDVYPQVPLCIDGVVYSNNVGTMLSEQLTLEVTLVLNDIQQAANTGDADVNQGLSDLMTLQGERAQQALPLINAFVTQLNEGTGIPEWLPACTADQLTFTTQLDEFEQTYDGLHDGLQAYLDSGTVDKETYLAVIKLVNDMDTAMKAAEQNTCADYYYRAFEDAYKFGDTFITLTLGQIAPDVQASASAEQFNTLLQYCNDALNAYINPEAATATAES